ncbi:response regulator [Spirochaetota bacterium]
MDENNLTYTSTMNERIIIAESESIIALDIKMQLVQMGYKVPAISNSSEETLKLIKKIKPDIIITNVKTSGKLDGIDTIKKIRKKNNTPVLFVTTYNDNETIERIKEIKNSNYLSKPFNPDDLHDALNTLHN